MQNLISNANAEVRKLWGASLSLFICKYNLINIRLCNVLHKHICSSLSLDLQYIQAYLGLYTIYDMYMCINPSKIQP
jgi:hypothetical protein